MNILLQEQFFVIRILQYNRNISMDARFWQNTFVEKKEIAAKAWLKYYPKICKIK